jgi:hypothetical protein
MKASPGTMQLQGVARINGDRVEVIFSVPITLDRSAMDSGTVALIAQAKTSHGQDFAAVNWNGTVYSFTPKQRIIVAALWRAREEGYGWLSQEALLEVAESDCGKVRDLFRHHPAWGTMIVSAIHYGGPLGSYKLADDMDDATLESRPNKTGKLACA